MSAATLVLFMLVIATIGALPTWRYSHGWGYAPSGILGAAAVIVLVLFLLGRL